MLEGFNIMNREMNRLSEVVLEAHLALARLHSVADGTDLFLERDDVEGRDTGEGRG